MRNERVIKTLKNLVSQSSWRAQKGMARKMTYVRRTKVIEDALILLFSIFTHNSFSFKICVNQSMYSLSTKIGKNYGQKHLSTNTANLRSGVSFSQNSQKGLNILMSPLNPSISKKGSFLGCEDFL